MWKAAAFVLLFGVAIWGGAAGDGRGTPNRGGQADSSGFRGNLLVVPVDGSHWVGIKALAQEMGRRGHRVTVVMPEVTIRVGPGEHYGTVTYPVPYDRDKVRSVLALQADFMRKSSWSLTERMTKRWTQIRSIGNLIHSNAESLLFNSSLMSHLAQQGFHAVLTDPLEPTGNFIARRFGIPTINLLRALPCSLDVKSAGCPSPPSYVPRYFTGYLDRMSFTERTVNTLVALLEPLLCRLIYWHFDVMAHRFFGEKVSTAEVLSESDVWLLRTDTIFETPRPVMPNMIHIGGINCNIRNPLPEGLESWLGGGHGFVVFTLGSLVSQMPEEKTSVFLEAFRQIPQKVIWRYAGQVPNHVPDNVKMMDWVPQNDLLAHPGARAFITHAGSHGLFEGLCHAVPMVMVPLGAEQPDNAQKLVKKGVGVMLDIHTLTTESLLRGLSDVINDSRYKEKVQELSALHKDRPVDPLDLAVFWTEFVMRHNGTKHLRPAARQLNWFQYFCLDVAALLVTVLLLLGMLMVKGLKLCLRKPAAKKKRE
ncbi:UDP-glucuronosyltransferase 1A1-like [Brachionichthys hirsutus]|uniref:UDP-glucuronosyltransferase 1A1-like n=1 Tax=Brachionichthys hirsutus TaxID=412623 RepID=UPI0036052181